MFLGGAEVPLQEEPVEHPDLLLPQVIEVVAQHALGQAHGHRQRQAADDLDGALGQALLREGHGQRLLAPVVPLPEPRVLAGVDERRDAHGARHVAQDLLHDAREVLLVDDVGAQLQVQRGDEVLHHGVGLLPRLARGDPGAGLGPQEVLRHALADRPQRVRLLGQEVRGRLAEVRRHDLHLQDVGLEPDERGDEHALLLLLLRGVAQHDPAGLVAGEGAAGRGVAPRARAHLLHEHRGRHGLLGVRGPEAPGLVRARVVVPVVLVELVLLVLLGLGEHRRLPVGVLLLVLLLALRRGLRRGQRRTLRLGLCGGFRVVRGQEAPALALRVLLLHLLVVQVAEDACAQRHAGHKSDHNQGARPT
mmetsp:Transcript_87808/g.272845  ORF Transcript_87808/g.272845 Transcript_87808/m.272845 type:complete len:363 (+) Transcript_87808:666-1754(+)